MEQKSNAFLEKEKVGTLMRKYAVPCIISLLVAALYNIVDQIFYRKRQLSGILRKCGQYGGISSDGSGAGSGCNDWRRLLRLCKYQPRGR